MEYFILMIFKSEKYKNKLDLLYGWSLKELSVENINRGTSFVIRLVTLLIQLKYLNSKQYYNKLEQNGLNFSSKASKPDRTIS